MTVSTTTSRWTPTGDGATLDFAYDNRIFAATDLTVYVDGVLKTLGADYTVSGVDINSGGNVSFLVAPAPAAKIVIEREVPAEQPTAYPSGGPFPSAAVEKAQDRLTILVQQLLAASARKVGLSASDAYSGALTLPSGALASPQALMMASAGFSLGPTTDQISTAQASATAAAGSAAAATTSATDAAASAAGVNLPPVAAGDAAKMLRVRDTEDGYQFAAAADIRAAGALGTAAALNAGTAGGDIPTFGDLTAYLGRNRIINGLPLVNQRGPQTAMATGSYFVDRFKWSQSGTGVADGATTVVSGVNWLTVTVTTADAVMDATDLYAVSQKIEADNLRDFNLGTAAAATVTMSFKHAHSKIGTYCVALRNAAADRCYIAEYTQSVANAEESAVVTLVLDTIGAWATSGNGTGLEVSFALGGGTGVQGAAGAWQAGAYLCTASQTNIMDTLGNTFLVREIQLERGPAATDFEREDAGATLMKCQRYFYTDVSTLDYRDALTCFSGNVSATATYVTKGYLPTKMRADGTITAIRADANVVNFPTTAGTLAVRGGQIITDQRVSSLSGVGQFFTHIQIDAEL